MKDSVLPVLVLLLLAFGLLLRVDFVFYIAYVCALLFAYSRWHTPRAMRNLKVTRDHVSNAFLGERVDVTITLDNPGRLPLPWLQLQEVTATQLRSGTDLNTVVHLAGHSSITLHYQIRAMRRGYYRIGPLLLQSGDLFGFRDQRGSFAADFITIYPRIVSLTRLSLRSRLPFGTLPSNQRLYEDPARPVGVRAFRSGDSLRQINWKVSARQSASASGGLMVKTVEPAISLDAFMLLNLDRERYSRNRFYEASEWAIEVAASLAAALTTQRQAIGLASNGHDPLSKDDTQFDEETGRLLTLAGAAEVFGEQTPYQLILPRNGREHLMKILGLLARLEARVTQQDFSDMISRATLDLNWGTTVIVITPRSDLKTINALHRLVRRGYNPLLLLIEYSHNIVEEQERARRLGFRAVGVSDEQALKRAFGG